MIEILNEKFPEEISFNILKFMSHPTADIIKHAYNHELFNHEDDAESFLFSWTMCGVLRYDCFECGKRKTKNMYCFKCCKKLRQYMLE
jgi:hypothetical protein